MKKKSIKNLSLNKKSISNLEANQGGNISGQNSIRFCIRTIVDQNGNNICLPTKRAATCGQTEPVGCAFTFEVDIFTVPIC